MQLLRFLRRNDRAHRRGTLALLTSVLVLAGARPVFADSVTIGGTNNPGGNCYPFSSCNTNISYQQVYSSADFKGLTNIDAITFFFERTLDGTSAISGDFTLELSTTQKAVNGLSTDEASNIGVDSMQFFSGVVSNTLTFTGVPYLYNPNLGNLLLTVTGSGTNFNLLVSGTDAADSSRVYDSLDDGPTADSQSLRTQFTTAAVTPEPGSFVLLGTGALGVAGILRRRYC